MKGLLEGCRVLGQRCWACGELRHASAVDNTSPAQGNTLEKNFCYGQTLSLIFQTKSPSGFFDRHREKNSTQNFIANLSELQGRYSGKRWIRCKSPFAYCTILSTRSKHARYRLPPLLPSAYVVHTLCSNNLPNYQRTLCSDLSQGHAALNRGTAKHQHPQDENAKYA